MPEPTITILSEAQQISATVPDEPVISFSINPQTGVTDHGALTGLNDDDHLLYLNRNGVRPVTGNLVVNGNLTVDDALGVVAQRVTVANDPTDDMELATKGYVDAAPSGMSVAEADYRYTPRAKQRRRAEFFRDTFNRADQPLKGTYTPSGHYWRGDDGFLVSNGTVVKDPSMPAARKFLMCDGMTRDIELSATIHIGTDADVGIVGRCYQDTGVSTKLYLSLRKTAAVNTFRLVDKDGVALATVSSALADNTTYDVRWVMSGTQHTVFLDDVQIIDITVANSIYSDYAGAGITYNGSYLNTNTYVEDLRAVALLPPQAQVLAHRGTTWALGETTEQKLATFADLPPVTGVECDVRLSSDGVPVLMHDATVDRTCPPFTGDVDTFTADELAGMGVATLEEFLDEAQRHGHIVLMQTQVTNVDYAPILAVLNALPSHDRIIFADYSNTNIQAAKSGGFTGPTLLFGATLANVDTLVGYAPDYIAIAPGDSAYMTNRAAVTTIKNAGIIPVASTVNRGDVVKAAVNDGAVLLTDVADLCSTALTPVVDRPRLHSDIATKEYVDSASGGLRWTSGPVETPEETSADFADTFSTDLSAWPTVTGNVSVAGGNAVFAPANSQARLGLSTSILSTTDRYIVARAKVRLTTLPGGTTADVLTLENTFGSRHFDFFVGANGRWWTDLYNVDFVDTGITVVAGDWYDLEAIVDFGTSTYEAWFKVNGAEFHLVSPSQTPSTARTLLLGTTSTAKTYTMHVDEVEVATSAYRPNFFSYTDPTGTTGVYHSSTSQALWTKTGGVWSQAGTLATKTYVDDPARNLYADLQSASVTMDDPDNQAVLRVNIEPGVPDPDTSAWPDRLQFRYWGVRTGTFNEYGEVRSDAAKPSTVALRAHGNYQGATNAIFQVRSRRADHTTPAPGVASYDIFDVWLDSVRAYQPVQVTNSDKTLTALDIDRDAASDSVNDADIFSVKYLGARAFWTNEVGLPRAQIPEGKSGEVGLKLISSTSDFQTDALQVIGPGSALLFKVGRYGGVTIAPTNTAAEGMKIQMPAASGNALHVTRGGTDVFRIGAADKVNIHAGLTMNSTKIESVATPTASTDAANKAYVDGRIWKGTQAAYDAIGTKDPAVLYVVTG